MYLIYLRIAIDVIQLVNIIHLLVPEVIFSGKKKVITL